MQVEIAKPEINAYGGNVIIQNKLRKHAVPQLIDNYLGIRPPQAYYNYSDFISALLLTILSNGSCVEDTNKHLKPQMPDFLNGKAPSSDSILKFMQRFATQDEYYRSQQNISYRFNSNLPLNRLNVKLLKHLNLVCQDAKAHNTLDYDHKPVYHDKKDKKRIYNGGWGYHPGVMFLNNYPVFIENRDGNANPSFQQSTALEKCITLLSEEGLPFKYFRADAASYQVEVMKLVEEASAFFYIRADQSDALRQKIAGLQGWEKINANGNEFEVSETTWQLTNDPAKKNYRVIVSRIPKHEQQGDLITGKGYVYRAIITNDYETPASEIVTFYNQRGSTEQRFSEQNEFGWANLPFSRLSENTVFLILTSMCYNLFCFLKSHLARRLKFVDYRCRLKRFIFEFVTVPAKWIKRGRRWILKLFTDKDYRPALE